jgi:hypothetical protein
MRLLYTVFLCALVPLQVVLVNVAEADRAACMDGATLQVSPSLLFPGHWLTLLLMVLAVVPLAALSFGAGRPSRADWVPAILMLCAILYLMLPPSAMHDCDRKGISGELSVIFLLPLSFFCASIALLSRKRSVE